MLYMQYLQAMLQGAYRGEGEGTGQLNVLACPTFMTSSTSQLNDKDHPFEYECPGGLELYAKWPVCSTPYAHVNTSEQHRRFPGDKRLGLHGLENPLCMACAHGYGLHGRRGCISATPSIRHAS